jgi:hypothetical protein
MTLLFKSIHFLQYYFNIIFLTYIEPELMLPLIQLLGTLHSYVLNLHKFLLSNSPRYIYISKYNLLFQATPQGFHLNIPVIKDFHPQKGPHMHLLISHRLLSFFWSSKMTLLDHPDTQEESLLHLPLDLHLAHLVLHRLHYHFGLLHLLGIFSSNCSMKDRKFYFFLL